MPLFLRRRSTSSSRRMVPPSSAAGSAALHFSLLALLRERGMVAVPYQRRHESLHVFRPVSASPPSVRASRASVEVLFFSVVETAAPGSLSQTD